MSGRAVAYDRYTHVAVALHWVIAVCILFNLSLGYFMEGFARPLRMTVLFMHASAGVTVLLLTAVRIVWRLTHRPPPFESGLSGYERKLAHGVHFLLYAGMLFMPLTGWAIISAHPPGAGPHLMVWGALPWPPLGFMQHLQPVALQKRWHENVVHLHGLGGFIMIGLLVLHVVGALKHQWFDGTPALQRMGFGKGRLQTVR